MSCGWPLELDLILGILIHEVVANMDPRICATLPMFAITGCVTISSFCGRGKKTAWNTVKVYPEVLKSFHRCKLRPVTWLWKQWNDLWCYFDCTNDIMNVNEAENIFYTGDQEL